MQIPDVTVYYLEMLSRAQHVVTPPRGDLAVVEATRPTLAFYRFLCNAVGKEYYWYRRERLADSELTTLIQGPLNEVHVLYVEGTPAGFSELDRRMSGDIKLVQFGLMREFIGQGLGKYLLHWTIDKAWSHNPRRFWLQTCTLDHPAALPNYLKAGFVVYKEELITEDIPDEMG